MTLPGGRRDLAAPRLEESFGPMTLLNTISEAAPRPLHLPVGAARASAARAGVAVRAALPDILLGASFPLALLALWWLGAARGWLPPQILPAPPVVWNSFTTLWADGSLATHAGASLGRVGTGFAIGAGVGLAFGAACGLFPGFKAYAWPPVQAVTRVNVLAWIPLFTLFLGIDDALKYAVIAWSASIPIMLGTARGIASVPAAWRELGRALGLGTGQTLRLIVVPAALPAIFTGLREGLANAWQTLVIVELFASFEGLGYLMTWGRQLFQLDLVLVAMAVIAAIGLLLDAALRLVEWRLQPWARGERGDGR